MTLCIFFCRNYFELDKFITDRGLQLVSPTDSMKFTVLPDEYSVWTMFRDYDIDSGVVCRMLYPDITVMKGVALCNPPAHHIKSSAPDGLHPLYSFTTTLLALILTYLL